MTVPGGHRSRTFVDADVLISIVRGVLPLAAAAAAILNAPERDFLSSSFVRLELLPKAVFHDNQQEITFYERFFAGVSHLATIDQELVDHAETLARQWNLNAMDALHLASAMQLEADEFVTGERSTSPLVKVTIAGLRIISLR